MTIETIKETIPDFAKDIRINIGRVLIPEGSPGLTQTQIHGIALASAYATRSNETITQIQKFTDSQITEAEKVAAKSAATIMAMNNTYYRTIGMLSDPTLSKLQTGLRMQILSNPGIPTIDFELYSLAVSAVNGCHYCVDSHAKKVHHAGISYEGIQSVIRIASVITALAQSHSITLKEDIT